MKIKKYQAASMPEAMKLIRSDLGNEAIILHSKVIYTGGILGFFKKRKIEVIAALDSKPAEPIQSVIQETQKPLYSTPQPLNSESAKMTNINEGKEHQEWQKGLSEIKSLINSALVSNGNGDGGIPMPIPIQKLKRLLTKQEINHDFIDNMLKMALEWWYVTGRKKSEYELMQWAKQYLLKRMSHLPFGGISFTKKYVNVVGPTGVGKTTTLAKIAADCILKYKKKVAFITTDTYRIAAIEQLKTYANILNVPVDVCYNLEDFQKAKLRFENYDIVFIDTAGRNFRNVKYVEDLNNIIDFGKEMESFLVLSLTSKQVDMEEILQQFSAVMIDKIIFTKADETSTYGAMFNIIHTGQKAAAYITNGQNVPDDIIEATPEQVVNRIIGVD